MITVTAHHWQVTHPGKDTDYVGDGKDNVLLIKGKLNGKSVEKKIEIDSKPFYDNPSVGLEGIVRFGKEKQEFRTIRPIICHSIK